MDGGEARARSGMRQRLVESRGPAMLLARGPKVLTAGSWSGFQRHPNLVNSSSTTYTTNKRRSGGVLSSLNLGFSSLEHTFSTVPASRTVTSSTHGRRTSLILRPPFIPILFASTRQGGSPAMILIGSGPSLKLNDWRFRLIGVRTFKEPGPKASLVPFCSLSPAVGLKSLCVGWDVLPLWEVFDLICSFPRLEDLHVVGVGRIVDVDNIPFPVRSSRLPGLTGTLVLEHKQPDIMHKLLELPSGLQFRKLVLTPGLNFGDRDVPSIRKGLIERCAGTLESIEVDFCTIAKSYTFEPLRPVSYRSSVYSIYVN